MAQNVYKPKEIEDKWKQKWQSEKMYRAVDGDPREKSYIMIEFPYPSGERLHVGHARSYICLDAVARKRRMQGMNVMFPFGWDAFGLPAENYAIKHQVSPQRSTEENIAHAKKQVIDWGLSFDWEREINTTDPKYYKWTQWIFVQLFKKGLAYKNEIAVNWCPSCKINLANEEVVDGRCERCGTETERRRQSQWILKITDYADRLLEDLKSVNYREDIAAQQINWIGKKEGARVKFQIANHKSQTLEAFTTRIDTIFGVTFVVVAPEIMKENLDWVEEKYKQAVSDYVSTALNKSERERKQKVEKSGIDTGIKVVNPADGQEVPVWVADYVMTDVGTGVVMGVPAHDARDEEFAIKYHLPIVKVIDSGQIAGGTKTEIYEGEGILINSGKYTGMESRTAREKMMAESLGERANHYHLRDWVFSRQHYWGEPIPMIFCPTCAKATEGKPNSGWVPVPEEQLPVKLPELEKYEPTGTGESPLSKVPEWVITVCPVCGQPAKRETDTMPNWAGSSWYYLRYCDPHNDTKIADIDRLKYWLMVDWYNGGMEHTTLHLLYSRFWHKFLYDIGMVPTIEPYARRTSHGVILGPDGRKMSKSKGNVINPDDVVNKFGADTLRLYEMFIGPFDQMLAWSWESLEGVSRFVKRVWNLVISSQNLEVSSSEAKRKMAKLISKVDNDLENMKFNTAVAAMMEWTNWWSDHTNEVGKEEIIKFILLLAPAAPFICEELYQRLTCQPEDKPAPTFQSVHAQTWPEAEVIDTTDEQITLAVQVNGKVRGTITSTGTANQNDVVEEALKLENVNKFVAGKSYKIVFVPKKILNLVVE